jgi:hypothetical protein
LSQLDWLPGSTGNSFHQGRTLVHVTLSLLKADTIQLDFLGLSAPKSGAPAVAFCMPALSGGDYLNYTSFSIFQAFFFI